MNIRRRIGREIGQLRKILKFKNKSKRPEQIRIEHNFKLSLSNIFAIENLSRDRTPSENVSMEIDEEGILSFLQMISMQ